MVSDTVNIHDSIEHSNPSRALRRFVVIEFSLSMLAAVIVAALFGLALFQREWSLDTGLSARGALLFLFGAPLLALMASVSVWALLGQLMHRRISRARQELHELVLSKGQGRLYDVTGPECYIHPEPDPAYDIQIVKLAISGRKHHDTGWQLAPAMGN